MRHREFGTLEGDQVGTVTFRQESTYEGESANHRTGACYEIEIPARIESIGPLCAFLNMIGECHGLRESELQSIEIAAYEIGLNIIEHAYGFDSNARIGVRMKMLPERAQLLFLDQGRAFDMDTIPEPDMADPHVRRRGRGFGLQIIRKSMDQIRYRRVAGQNQLYLVKLIGNRAHARSRVLAMQKGDIA